MIFINRQEISLELNHLSLKWAFLVLIQKAIAVTQGMFLMFYAFTAVVFTEGLAGQ